MKSITAKTICALTAAVLLCGCSESGSSGKPTDELISMTGEADVTDGDIYATFPDGVRLDSDAATEILPDSSGFINSPKYGVKFSLPPRYRAYDYDNRQGEKGTHNFTCDDALFITSPYFPDVKEYMRISCEGELMIAVKSYDYMKSNHYPSLKYTEYTDYIKNDISYYSAYIMQNEYSDTYDYVGVKTQDEGDTYKSIPEGSSQTSVDYLTLEIAGVSGHRRKDKNSEITDMKSEPVEFADGKLGLRIDYRLKRKGKLVDREVYWLWQKDCRALIRIEVDKDPNAAEASRDTRALLEGIELSTPETGMIIQEDDLYTDGDSEEK